MPLPNWEGHFVIDAVLAGYLFRFPFAFLLGEETQQSGGRAQAHQEPHAHTVPGLRHVGQRCAVLLQLLDGLLLGEHGQGRILISQELLLPGLLSQRRVVVTQLLLGGLLPAGLGALDGLRACLLYTSDAADEFITV